MKRLILALLMGAALASPFPAYAAVKTIVLVHGAFADGSGWKPVADILQSHGSRPAQDSDRLGQCQPSGLSRMRDVQADGDVHSA